MCAEGAHSIAAAESARRETADEGVRRKGCELEPVCELEDVCARGSECENESQ